MSDREPGELGRAGAGAWAGTWAGAEPMARAPRPEPKRACAALYARSMPSAMAFISAAKWASSNDEPLVSQSWCRSEGSSSSLSSR